MAFGEQTTPEIEHIATEIVDAAFRVHSRLGPGLLESVYETCLAFELQKRHLSVRRQVDIPIQYDSMRLEGAFRVDLIVADLILVEIKAVEKHNPLYDAQLLTYLKLSNKKLGFLINFNVKIIKDGIKRVVR